MSDTQRLPNLYQLLGLNGLENKTDKISAAIKRAQAKVDSLKADAERTTDAARLQKVVALGQKYLLSPALKSIYDAQWESIYGSAAALNIDPVATPKVASQVARPVAAPVVQAVAASVATVAATSITATSTTTTSAHELSWDMSSLEALLPVADPHAPFQMAEYLRASQVRDPLAAEADLRKLISLLGGELAPSSEPTTASQTISLHQLSTGAEHESFSSDAGVSLPRSTNTSAGAALAKRMRQKRQRAMLLGGGLLTAAVAGLGLFSLYLNQPTTKATEPVAQLPPKATQTPVPAAGDSQEPAVEKPSENAPPKLTTGLIQPGENVKPLEIQATPLPKPDVMATPDKAAMEPMKPATPPEPAKPEPTKPEPTPEPAKPAMEPAKPAAAQSEAAKPPAADVKLTNKEKKVWQDDMKRVRAGLSKLDPAASEQQLESLKPLCKTAEQQSQLATLQQAAGLIRKAREALVAGIGGLESAQTFMVGNSTEVAFVEGDETRIIVRVAEGRKEYKLDTIPAAMALVIMKMKPNVVDINLEAAMGAYIMVQTKKNNAATTQGKKLLEDAAGLGAISKEVAQFYEEDYKL